MNTPIETRAEILADLWMNYRLDDEFKDFVEYNDLGLPLAYAVTANIISNNKQVDDLMDETFEILLSALNIEEDLGFESLDDMLGSLI
jgi:hypothetical protein